MSKENLKERLVYFEGKLEEAKRKARAKELRPRTFDAGYTTERLKTWAESIALIETRIFSIREQLALK